MKKALSGIIITGLIIGCQSMKTDSQGNQQTADLFESDKFIDKSYQSNTVSKQNDADEQDSEFDALKELDKLDAEFGELTLDKLAQTDDENDVYDPDITHKYRYKVRGKHYNVFKSSKNFQQTGSASWYGPGFHGKKTANGEIYDMYAMTAAHKTLPLGTRVQVTNLSNGRKIIVRINDRGPFHGGRIIDLSKAAAQKLHIIQSGHAKVHIKTID